MEILVVGAGRCGTVSLTKWFNELFKRNNITGQVAHEYLAKESYIAFDEYYRTGNEDVLKSVVSQIYQSGFDAVVGNGYANILPYFATMKNDIVLIHLQRRDRNAWISSSARNAKYYPSAYQYYVPESLLDINSNANIPRTAAFQVGESSIEEWTAWSLEEKLGWHYDYTHRTITKHSSLFSKTLHIYTEDLNDLSVLSKIANLVVPDCRNIPAVPKLNSHYFADIERYSDEHRPFAQWLLGNIDWDEAVTNPAYLFSYSMNSFETWIGWCQSGMANQICPKNVLNIEEMRSLIKLEILPKLKRSIRLLEVV